jgi:hypothetical protein
MIARLLENLIPPGVVKMRWLSEHLHRSYPNPKSLSN